MATDRAKRHAREARNRAAAAARKEATEVARLGPIRYSEPWPCPNCSDIEPDEPADNVIYVIRQGWARCSRCGYGAQRTRFGFATFDTRPELPPGTRETCCS